MKNNKNNDGRVLDDFFDDNPTDELPVLAHPDSAGTNDDTANSLAPDPQLFDDNSPTGTRITALEPGTPKTENQDSTISRLETEIQQLQARWLEIENKLHHRDAHIQTLEDKLLQSTAACQELECKLQAVAAERASIESAAADLTLELKQRDVDIEQISDRAEVTRLKLEEQQSAVNTLQIKLDEQHKAADNSQTSIESSKLHSTALEEMNLIQRNELATLAGYIDGRKNDWHQSEQNLIQQRQTIDALERSLTDAESLLIQKEREKEALGLQNIDFQHRLTALEDQEAEYRRRNDSLLLQLEQNTLLLKQHREVDNNFERQRTQLQTQIMRLESKHESSQKKICQLEQNFQGRDNEALVLKNSLEAETDNNQLLREASEKLEERLRSQAISQHELEEQLTALLAEASNKDQTIDRLRNELRTGQQSLKTVLEEVDRLGSVEASIHKLDAQMSQQLSDKNPGGERSVTCLMVATDGNQVMKHPLYKDVITIGRSHHSDIQIRTQYVSRDHAHILTDDLGTVIEDLGSKNGIRVNSMQVGKRRLKHGDRVDIGEVHFKFVNLTDQNTNQR